MRSRLKYASRKLDGNGNPGGKHELIRLAGFNDSSTADDLQRDEAKTSPPIETAAKLGIEGSQRDHLQSQRKIGPISIVALALREREWESNCEVFVRATLLCCRR